LKTLLEAGRLSAIMAIFVVTCMQAQQPPPQTQPGTPATAAPVSTSAPQTTPAPQTSPARPASQDQRDAPSPPAPGLYAPWSAEIFYWLTYTSPSLHGGAKAPDFESLDYPGHGKYTPGVALSIPVSKTGMLNLSAFITKGTSNTTITQAADLFGTSYAAGDLLTADYRIRDFKVSLQDLFFPFPRKEGQKWRIKTLWEVQYVSMTTNINAPYATDSAGNIVVNTAKGTRSVVYPTFGLAGELNDSGGRLARFFVEGVLGHRLSLLAQLPRLRQCALRFMLLSL